MKRVRIRVSGQVQGVGFRPFVYRLATELKLSGQVGNTPEGVIIEVQGKAAVLDEFVRRVQSDAPPLARIVDLEVCTAGLSALAEETAFRIETSVPRGSGHAVLISPDVAVCPDCLHELFDPGNRRFLYPFINCTNCGPRFTITRSIPYDRAATSMACFPLCPDCAEEYADPTNRRFHAQPNACPVCGPRLWVQGTRGEQARYADALHAAAQAIVDGKIVAVRGLGGFHLTCDARNPHALTELRRRKDRPHKSLAVMAKNIDAVRRMAVANQTETALLTSPACPIVILPRIPNALPELIAPDIDSIGVMLPSTPLHHVLLHAVTRLSPATDVLVMTSGNARGEPLCLGNREAVARLDTVADLFLLHNRDILVRADDSVLRVVDDKPLLYRRARGYTPSPVPFFGSNDKAVFGVGAHLKSTVCCTRRTSAFVSQHIGDLENEAVTDFYTDASDHLLRLLDVEPQAVVCDLHPDYSSTRFAREFAEQRGIPLLAVQHHVAHHHAVLGEHGHSGPALGLILDGTGYGQSGGSDKDDTGYGQSGGNSPIWGGELLLSIPGKETRRIGRLSPFALPGGEKAIREPWRLAVGLYPDAALPPHLAMHPQTEAVRELSRSPACLRTSSCGRLFDAVAALLNLCTTITYEGQAAIRLEHVQDFAARTEYVIPLHDRELLELDAPALFAHLAGLQPCATPGMLARVFHLALMDGLCRLVRTAAHRHGISAVALGGGVFQNVTLARELPARLRSVGLTPLLPDQLPPGDGAISYGQVVWASTRL